MEITRGCAEIITEQELDQLLNKSTKRAYVGFEPSGLVHLGIALEVRKLMDLNDAGFETIVLLADWHAWINDKFNGDIDKIRVCASYMKDCFLALGLKNSRFVYAKDMIEKEGYLEKVIRIARATSLSRIKRAMPIMGRDESQILDSSKIIYPMMQIADIFALDVDLALGGIDQRHAHMLARDISSKLNWKKVVAMHTPMLPSLEGKGRMESKMSKSNPKSCIFVHDSRDEMERKISKAFCPPKDVENNPILAIWKSFIPQFHDECEGENENVYMNYTSYVDMESSYKRGEIGPQELKKGTIAELDKILAPVREKIISSENYEKLL